MAPGWLPFKEISATLVEAPSGPRTSYSLNRNEVLNIRHGLHGGGGYMELQFAPVFRPKMLGLNEDDRTLACICESCHVVSQKGSVDLLENRG